MDSNSIILLIFFLTFAAITPKLHADYEVLKIRAAKALEASVNAHDPNPEEATINFNKQVEEALQSVNNKKEEGCKAVNPIDRCWRCDPNWANNRKRLADCSLGFGQGTTGGKDGKFYIVTDPSDNDTHEPKSGTLRHAVIQDEPLWIIFKHTMTIKLTQELFITDNKTIDGRGVEVRIANGAGLTIQFAQNVIIHNIRIHNIVPTSGTKIRDSASHVGVRGLSDGDGIRIFRSNHVWIDHVSLAKCSDGLIDATLAATAITISNCKFNHHNSALLFGADDEHIEDKIMQVTVAFNRFGRGLVQRMPRCRHGFFHVVNNDYHQWKMYAIGGSADPTVLSQGNQYKASRNSFAKEVTKRNFAEKSEWMKWQWRSEGDVFLNGAYFVQSGSPFLKENTTDLHGSYVSALTHHAGPLSCRNDIPC